MKFKIGDKVKIIIKKDGDNWNHHMNATIETIGEIKQIFTNDVSYSVKVLNGSTWNYHEDCLELATKTNYKIVVDNKFFKFKKEQQITLSDLVLKDACKESLKWFVNQYAGIVYITKEQLMNDLTNETLHKKDWKNWMQRSSSADVSNEKTDYTDWMNWLEEHYPDYKSNDNEITLSDISYRNGFYVEQTKVLYMFWNQNTQNNNSILVSTFSPLEIVLYSDSKVMKEILNDCVVNKNYKVLAFGNRMDVKEYIFDKIRNGEIK
jgi:hypothetical protein